ncbi:nicotinate-nucleotide--dimethylbenzimidazole phosphoribosyltransferase [Streptomyces sp. NPDC059701]|uniref:nicotinate-nucleotide--dimethylbenzimidazole phosphoribosyltransferase n=1 Tax=Streptomyces sp. NPDC059701 TaxID=3346914 RepID=UPI0036CEC4F2
MTDTGQIPGEGLPENAGMVEQPGVPAPGAYTYLSETTAEDEDLLLLPGAQSAWGNEVAPPAPEPVVETVHQPGPHEMSGRDSGSVDLGGVRLPEPVAEPASPPSPPRRPLHLGPPIPDASASPVRSLADRGPASVPMRHAGPPTAGPEYLDVPQAAAMPPQGAAPWGAQPAPSGAGAAPGETVVPAAEQRPEPVGAAEALVTRVATEAVAATGGAPEPEEAGEPAAEAHEQAAAGDDTVPGDAAHATEAAVTADGGVEPPEEGAPGTDGAPVAGDVPAADAAQQPPARMPGAEPGPAGVPATEAVVPESVPVAGMPGDGAVSVSEAQADQAADVVPAPEAEAGQSGAPEPAPVPRPGEEAPVAEAPVSEPAPVAEAAVPESAPVVDAPAPVTAPVPEAVAAPAPVAEAVAPESATVAGVPGDAAVTVPEAQADQAADVVPAPEAGAEQPGDPEPTTGILPPAEDVPAAAAPVSEPDAEVPEPPVAEEAEPLAEPVGGPAPQPSPAAVQTPPAEPAPTAEPAAPEPIAVTEPAAPAATAEPTAPEPTATAEPTAPEPIAVTEPTAPAEPGPAPVPQPQPAGETVGQDVQAPAVPGPSPEAPVDPTTAPAAFVAEEAAPVQDHPGLPHPAQGPQSLPTADAAPQTHAEPHAEPAAGQAPGPDQPVGRFMPVDGGQVPTTPHLAPTPPEALVLPPEAPAAPAQDPVAGIPAPREADVEVAQNADDLDTRAADQEDPHDADTAVGTDVRRSTGPAAPAYDDAEREAVLKVMRERRDIRNGFRGDPIPHEVLLRVLEAAHTAPSVGHSQPWDFVVIRSADTRRAMHELAMRQRDAYAKSLPKGRAKQFKELKIEAILDTPVNIVVTADPTRGGRHTLGRHTQPQMAPYSSALAVENLWLAARAEGLGVGWVSFFDEREMVRALGLPEHLEVVAYLCVGYVDEFPDEPELMQAGWSKRRPLSWVVHEETYGRRALPGEEPHDLLAETVAQIRPLDAKALGEAWERQKRMTKPAGALGMLEIISAQLSGLSRQCPPPVPEPAAVAVFAGDHGVHAQGVTPWPQEVTAQMVANFLGGGAVCNAFATQVGAEVCVVDVGVAADLPATPGLLPRKVRAGTSDMTTGPAMTREEAKQAIEVGIETARDLVAAGNKALLTGEMGIANTTASAALISVFTGADPAEVTGRGTGINDETLVRKTEVVRRALELHQPDPADPIGVLAAIGGFEHAAMVGLLLGGASLRTPVILDGVSAGAAALVARAIAPEVLAACIAGHRSAEPGHVAALNKLGLRPLVDLDLRLGEGTGALLALPMVQSTARAMHEVATFDSAGVTEK